MAQHLLLQMHSMSITPECYSGILVKNTPSFRKGLGVGYICRFLRFSYLIYLSYTLPSSAERRAGEDRANNGTTPRQQKVLFVNICHRYWLFSARGFPRKFPSGHSGTSRTAVPLPLGCPALRGPR